MNIRAAVEKDIEAILEIFNYSIIHTTTVYSYDPYSYQMMKDWYDEKIAKGLPILIAEIGGQLIGYATYGTFRARAAYRSTAEHSVYVHEEFQQRGIGKALLLALIKTAKANGIHALIGGVDAVNEGSVAFHKKMGFEEVGHLKEVAYKFDRWLDLKFLQLILK